jgi:hypothetical protein
VSIEGWWNDVVQRDLRHHPVAAQRLEDMRVHLAHLVEGCLGVEGVVGFLPQDTVPSLLLSAVVEATGRAHVRRALMAVVDAVSADVDGFPHDLHRRCAAVAGSWLTPPTYDRVQVEAVSMQSVTSQLVQLATPAAIYRCRAKVAPEVVRAYLYDQCHFDLLQWATEPPKVAGDAASVDGPPGATLADLLAFCPVEKHVAFTITSASTAAMAKRCAAAGAPVVHEGVAVVDLATCRTARDVGVCLQGLVGDVGSPGGAAPHTVLFLADLRTVATTVINSLRYKPRCPSFGGRLTWLHPA